MAGYLSRLGISHVYSSPYLQAAPGSMHGYDVIDHARVNVELGGEDGHARFCRVLGEHGLGQLLDVVPNHMAIAGHLNRWWWDVLENGPSSRYATYFDVAWDPPEQKLKHVILVPVLGDHYGRVLEAGHLRLERRGDVGLVIRYYEHEFPVDPRSYEVVIGDGFGGLGLRFGSLPVVAPSDRAGARARHVEKEQLLERLRRAEPGPELDARILAVNTDVDRLDQLLDRQNYRLARWQTASYELDYRRFFDVTSLVGLRMEDPEVFADTHVRILEWLHTGVIDGVRIDHPDGLRDPLDYLSRLRRAAPRAWVVVEKILATGEQLPASWPVAGTTGYDFLNLALGVLVDPAAEDAFTDIYARATGQRGTFAEAAYRARRLVLRELLGSDLSRLTGLFVRVCEGNRRYRDYTRHELGECLAEVIACMPVYRTYVRPDEPASAADRASIDQAVTEAGARRQDLDPELLELLRRLLVQEDTGDHTAEFVARFQQTTSPVMAKGVEDTALYTYNRFVALNEVGGDPGRFGVGVDGFHRACAEAAQRRPLGMLTTSTHDTKRSEDVRARLAALSEVPEAWGRAVAGWMAHNQRHRRDGLPDRNAEYLLYQTLVGAWPIARDRLLPYLEKAAREAKARTSWLAPDAVYEQALLGFATAILDDAEFVGSLEAFLEPVAVAGRVNSLAMKLLCLTAPGVPDVYQGSELWDLSLVDPDNRRPIDYPLRSRLLGELDALGGGAAEAAWARQETGLAKLLVLSRALRLRAERPDLFAEGAYEPLVVTGPERDHALAFCRGGGAATIVPRHASHLRGRWSDTAVALPAGTWVDQFTGCVHEGGPVPVQRLLASFPVALLARAEPAA